jgi:hypothetical protein
LKVCGLHHADGPSSGWLPKMIEHEVAKHMSKLSHAISTKVSLKQKHKHGHGVVDRVSSETGRSSGSFWETTRVITAVGCGIESIVSTFSR